MSSMVGGTLNRVEVTGNAAKLMSKTAIAVAYARAVRRNNRGHRTTNKGISAAGNIHR
jgi:hypothetical protein